jgi:membrane fusion protein (multidrug efflux system)
MHPPSASHRRRWPLLGAAIAVVVGVLLVLGIGWLEHYLHVVSTEDAYVNGHVTYIAARIDSKVDEVLVNDNDYVQPGQVLVRLDSVPYQLAVAQRQAELQVAQAQLAQTRAQVLSTEAQARANWFSVVAAQENVRAEIAKLRAEIATLEVKQANLVLAQHEYERIAKLVKENAATAEDLDHARDELDVASSEVTAAQQAIRQTRTGLGLDADVDDPAAVPDDLDQKSSAVQIALSQWALSIAEIGLPLQLYGMTPRAMYDQIAGMNSGNLNKTLALQVEQAPATQLARAKVRAAQKQLDHAELELGYTEIRSPIAAYVTHRTVNPGDTIEARQALMALWPLEDVWIDANFKETQLESLTVGQPVDVYVDTYPGRIFKGRVEGFSSGTGAALALLPPENATGNWVKVVQRLTVRIALTDPVPRETPLFVGLSCHAEVQLTGRPTGPNAGQRLRGRVGPPAAPAPKANPAEPPRNSQSRPAPEAAGGATGGTP